VNATNEGKFEPPALLILTLPADVNDCVITANGRALAMRVRFSVIAAGVLLVLGLAPAHGQIRPSDRIRDFNHAEALAKSTSAALSRFTGRECLDAAAVDAAAHDVNALADYRVVRGISGFATEPSTARIRALDNSIAQMQATLAELNKKPHCPPPGAAKPPPAQAPPETKPAAPH